jgi:hypothetical protein
MKTMTPKWRWLLNYCMAHELPAADANAWEQAKRAYRTAYPDGMYWEPDTDYPVEDWKAEVAANETRLGYWDWIESKHELEGVAA